MLRFDFPEVHLIRSSLNLGYAAGNNLAFSFAQGDYLLTLNPDTEFFDQSLDYAIDLLETKSDIGALGARLILPDHSTQRSVRGFPTMSGLLGEFSFLRKWFPRSRLASYRLDSFDYTTAQVAPQPMGTFLLFKKEALEAVGSIKKPFDERFPIFFNEVDLLYRLNEAGWPCYYSPKVQVKHLGGESTKQVRRSMIWESHRSLIRFMRKHYGTPWNTPGMSLLAAAFWLAAFVRARGYHGGFGH
jgi:GT2 family glycosyltransferase